MIFKEQLITIILNQQTMSSHNESKYNLPLQINSNVLNLEKLQSQRSKDMPRQLKNDLYRQMERGKYNLKRVDQNIIEKSVFQFDCQALFSVKKTQKNQTSKQNHSLRDLIKKKLLDVDKIKSNKTNNPPVTDCRQNKQNQAKTNRYQQLLCQIYGKPVKNSSKDNNLVANNNPKTQQKQSIKRYSSLKKLNQIQSAKQSSKLGRYKSQSSLSFKSPVRSNQKNIQNTAKINNSIPKQMTYLDLYMQRKHLLIL